MMTKEALKQKETRHQVWLSNETYEYILKNKTRDESINSFVGFLVEFYKNASPQLEITKSKNSMPQKEFEEFCNKCLKEVEKEFDKV